MLSSGAIFCIFPASFFLCPSSSSTGLSLSLPIVLSVLWTHRKTESYPGPVLEAEVQPLDGIQGGKVKRRGHRYTEGFLHWFNPKWRSGMATNKKNWFNLPQKAQSHQIIIQNTFQGGMEAQCGFQSSPTAGLSQLFPQMRLTLKTNHCWAASNKLYIRRVRHLPGTVATQASQWLNMKGD